MIFIGITGGVGAGKSEILSYLEKKDATRVMLADEIAHMVMEPEQEAYMQICEAFEGEDIFVEEFENICFEGGDSYIVPKRFPAFDRGKLAQVIFSDEEKRERLNAIVHPAVKKYVKEQFQLEKERGKIQVLVLEAALLIEEHYDEICDELWYIYTSEENRRERLKASRGYSDEKINQIFKSQLSEQSFREAACEVIDNNGAKEDAFCQIDIALENALRRRTHEYCIWT